jgi:hypothetical protein
VSAKSWQSRHYTEKLQHPSRLVLQIQPAQCREELTSLEEKFIAPLREGEYLFRFAQLQACRTDAGRLNGCLFRRFGPSLSSQAIRFGCVLYSMFKFGDATKESLNHLIYLDKFYSAMRRAIDRRSFSEVAYGSFTATMYCLKLHRPFPEIVAHTKAFRVSVQLLLISDGIINEETFLLECMWEKLIWQMSRQMIFRSSSSLDMLCQMMEFARPLSLSDYTFSPWMAETLDNIKLKFDFLRFFISLQRQHNIGTDSLQELLLSAFLKSWELAFVAIHLRKLFRAAWGRLIASLSPIFELDSPRTPDCATLKEMICSVLGSLPRESTAMELAFALSDLSALISYHLQQDRRLHQFLS